MDTGSVHGIDPAYIDHRVNPTEDFYQFANGAWLDKAKIPADESLISANTMACARNADLVRRLVAYITQDKTAAPGSPEQLIGEFYRVGMDTERAERVGTKPIDEELVRIGQMASEKDVMSELGRLHRWYVDAVFSSRVLCDTTDNSHKLLDLWQGGLSLRSPEAYSATDAHSTTLRSVLTDCVHSSMVLLGDSPALASERAQQVLEVESKLAAAWRPSVEIADAESTVHHMKLWELGNDVPNVDWWKYFKAVGEPSPSLLNVSQPAYLRAFGKLLKDLPIESWRSYLRWRFIATMSPYLSSSFVAQTQRLNAAITGQYESESRDQVVLWETDAALGPELSRLLERAGVGVRTESKALAIVQDVRSALRQSLLGASWMTSTTREKALDKLDRIRVEVGYPSHWRDSSKLIVEGDSYIQNALRVREFEFQRKLDELSQPTDREEWKVSAYAAAAYYDTSLNTIVLPAGLLQAPYFDSSADDASNYGAFGAVVGHEFMHGFDAQGRKYDAAGNLNGWWCKSDETKFQAYEQGVVDQYNGYKMPDARRIDGRLTLAENMADLGGVRIAYAAYKKATTGQSLNPSGGLTPDQRFFVAFSQVFRCKARPEIERLSLETNFHAPPRFRVIGALQDMPEFWTAFGGVAPKQTLKIW